ncbi:glycosyltransferase [Candidatus Gottesmanbacteria bacterium]|nr:glycosyltransferase [Candidatus Gottesmanbacteria bacterium]
MKLVSFVIPLYNASASVRDLTARILSTRIPGNKQIVYINDGSTDNTDKIVRSLAAKNTSITYIQLAANFGQHNAIITGLRYARGSIIVCLDDDLQTPPEETSVLINEMEKRHAHVVYGQYETNEDPIRRIGTRLHNITAQLFGKPKAVTLTSFFCMTGAVSQRVSQYKGTLVYLPGIVLRVTKNIYSTPVRHESRKYGRSGYTFLSLMKLWAIGVLVYLHLADLYRAQPVAVIKNSVNITSTRRSRGSLHR